MATFRIALALGGGAARGWAHIGVIRALHELKIEADIVAGTSIGSLVGAGYAANKLDQLEKWVRQMDRWQVFKLLDFGLKHGGFIQGERVFKHAEKLLGAERIEDLPKRYAAVATDLYTGREVWLQQGDAYACARASCAVPGLLAALQIGDRWLVDGGLVNPVPVSLARALGGDFVIAVNLNAEQGHHDQAGDEPGMLAVMTNAIDIMQERITRARMAGDPPDILIQPKLGEIGLLEFARGAEAIELGYQATMRLAEQIESEWATAQKRGRRAVDKKPA